ncbi:MAG TPA: cell division protein ZapA [Alphaproteobacteria bacterium]|nr:cell division protein ZapA [Alphaproteobacteria bacterium]
MVSAVPTTITVGGKEYRMVVPAGEEGRIKALAARVDGMLADLRRADPNIDRDRQLLLACLELADSLGHAQSKAETQNEAVSRFHRQLAERLESLIS